jgi:sporulation related protein
MAALLAPIAPLSAAEGPAPTVGASQNLDALDSTSSESESSAEISLRTGIRAYVTGELKLAAASLSTALQGRLDSNQTARALLYRGLTYRKQGMPGRAVSDLTSALQQADGLSDAERNEVEHNRIAASREAGLPETETVVVTLSPKEDAQSTNAASVIREPAPAPAMDASIVTGSIAPAHEPRQTSSDWSGATNVAAAALAQPAQASTAFVTQVAAVAPEKKSEAPGHVHLQIASVHSRSEAFALSVRLTSQYGSEFGNHKLKVSETLAENQGTTYRLRLGPYANAEEPQKLCASLRAGGYECALE